MWCYGAYHYFTRAHPAAHYDALASSVYFGYLTIFCYAMWVLTGFIGFFATFQVSFASIVGLFCLYTRSLLSYGRSLLCLSLMTLVRPA